MDIEKFDALLDKVPSTPIINAVPPVFSSICQALPTEVIENIKNTFSYLIECKEMTPLYWTNYKTANTILQNRTVFDYKKSNIVRVVSFCKN